MRRAIAKRLAQVGADGKPPTIFDRIIAGDVPAKKVYEDTLVLAFHDIAPQAPVHVLLIPKQRDGLTQLKFAEERHAAVLGHMLVTAPLVARLAGIDDYRLVINDGLGAGQSVFHLHMHIFGGRNLSWPPG